MNRSLSVSQGQDAEPGGVAEDELVALPGGGNVGGSPIDWVMKTKGVSLRHAVELLRADQQSHLKAITILTGNRSAKGGRRSGEDRTLEARGADRGVLQAQLRFCATLQKLRSQIVGIGLRQVVTGTLAKAFAFLSGIGLDRIDHEPDDQRRGSPLKREARVSFKKGEA